MKLRKYNPSLLSDSEIVEQFVARKNDFDILLQMIRENIGRSSNQHVMVIGPRGMGKTLLMLRLVAEVRRDAELSRAWFPLMLAEESYMVGNAAEFWLEAVLKLSEIEKDERLKMTYERLLGEKDNKVLYEKALKALMDFVDARSRHLMIVIENLNMLFDEQMKDEDGWLLRETLIHESRIMLIATATSRFDQIQNIKQPMFELFAVRDLRPLTPSDCQNIWKLVTGKEVSPHRIRPIEILTGGNPRLLVILSSFAATSSFKELMENLISLVDDHTNYLKSNTESLPSLERKVFVALADIWSPATAKEVGIATRLSVNQASNQLVRLEKSGAVIVQRVEGRKKYYQLAERLYNIYHQMRRRGSQSSRVRTAVKFMVEYYEEKELQELIRSLSKESLTLPPKEREYHFQAMEQILSLPRKSDMRIQLVASIDPQIFECEDTPPGLKALIIGTKNFNGEMIDKKDTLFETRPQAGSTGLTEDERCELFVELIQKNPEIFINVLEKYHQNPERNNFIFKIAENYFNKKSFNKDRRLASVEKNISKAALWNEFAKELNIVGARVEAEYACRKAIEKDKTYMPAWVNLAHTLILLKRYADAESAYRKAIEQNPGHVQVWNGFGNFLFKIDNFKEAEIAYRKAIELNANHVQVWNNLGNVLAIQRRFGEAEFAYRKATEIDSNYESAWHGLGFALDCQGRYKEAEEPYRKAIVLNKGYVHAWDSLGDTLSNQSRYEEAEVAYRKAIELQPDYVPAWNGLGNVLNYQERNEEAETAYRKAIEFDLSYVPAWDNLGDTLSTQSRYEEAEVAYRKAIEVQPDYVPAWNGLGNVLNYQERNEEAETAYRKAIEVDPDCIPAWNNLGNALNYQGRNEEAETIYRKAIEIDRDSVSAWYGLGNTLFDQDRYIEAETAYRKAVEIDPGHARAWGNLGYILNSQDRYSEAEIVFDKSIELNPENPNFWSAMATSLQNQGKFVEAEKACMRAYELDPDLLGMDWTVGFTLFFLGNFDASQRIFEIAVSQNPDYALLYNNLGYINLAKRQFVESKSKLLKAIELEPGCCLYYANLGIVLQNLGMAADASKCFDRATELLSDTEPCLAELNSLVTFCILQKREKDFVKAEEWIKKVRTQSPYTSEYAFTYARLLAALNRWDESLLQINDFLANPSFARNFIVDVTNFFIAAASAGFTKDSFQVLNGSPSAEYYEPLLVALQKNMRQTTNAPLEIYEMAKDIAAEMEKQREKA